MSIAEIERFAADLKSNEALRAEAGKAQAETSQATPMDRVIAFAASKGYAFTADEVKEHAKAKQLTDAELDGVAGGLGPRAELNSVNQTFIQRIQSMNGTASADAAAIQLQIEGR
jgi:predicted ribosomally synthesized peptide with nif11-like leader